MKKIVFVIAAVLMAAFTGYAQKHNRNIATQQNGWLPVSIIAKTSSKWGFGLEAQFRHAGPFTEMQQLLLRGGIDHYVNETVMLTAGYGYIITYPYGEQPVLREFYEHRGWQQVSLSHKSGRVSFGHRYRLEQRWLQNQQAELRDEHIYLNRLRYRALVNVPVNRKTIEHGSIFVSLANEAFVNFGENVKYNIFDQNRAYAGIGYQFANNVQVQAGYLNHLVFKANGIDHENNHTYQLGITWKVDLQKKEDIKE